MINPRQRALAVALTFFLGASSLAYSQEEEGTYETTTATVTKWGDTGYFDVFSAYTLLKNKVSVAVFRDNVDRDPFNLDISNLTGTVAYGVTDKFEVFGRIDFQRRILAQGIGDALIAVFPPPHYNDEPRVYKRWATGFGDVWFGGKYNVLSEYDDAPVGLAVRGFVKLPTASSDAGLGTGGTSGGGHLVLSKNLGSMVGSSYYAGFRANGTDSDLGYSVGNAFEWGAGINVPRDGNLRATVELTGSAYTGADYKQTDPVDLLAGVTYQMENGVYVTAGLRTNVNFQQEGITATGLNVSVGYHPGTRGNFIPPPPPRAPSK